jgi:hypothetical protein
MLATGFASTRRGNRSVSRLLHHDWRRWSSSTPQWCCWSRTHAATGMGAAKSGLTFSLRRKPNLQVTAASMTRHLQRPREWPPSALENGSTSRSSTRDGVSLSDGPECSEPTRRALLAARIDVEARSPVGVAKSCRRDVLLALVRFCSTDLSGSNGPDPAPLQKRAELDARRPLGSRMARAMGSRSFAGVRKPPGGSQGASRSP